MSTTNVDKVQIKMAQVVVKDAKVNLKRKGKNSSGKLSKSLRYKIVEKGYGEDINFSMQAYGMGVDAGRRGTKSSPSQPNSIFKTSSAGQPPVQAIEPWVRQRRMTPNKGVSIRSLAFSVAKSIGERGSKGSGFFSEAFNKQYRIFPDNLAGAVADDAMIDISEELDKLPKVIGK